MSAGSHRACMPLRIKARTSCTTEESLQVSTSSFCGTYIQGRTEEFGEGGVQCEFDEGAGREVALLKERRSGAEPQKHLASNVSKTQ